MCEGAEQSPWAVPRLLDVIALGGLVYLRVELLLRARMAVPTRVTSFTIARLAPLLSVLYVWTWCATILIFSWWSTFILEKKMHVFFCLQNSICLHVTEQLLWALKEIQMSCDFSVCSFIKILSVLQHNSSLFCKLLCILCVLYNLKNVFAIYAILNEFSLCFGLSKPFSTHHLYQ